MADSSSSVRVKKPPSVWKRPVKIKAVKLATALAKGIFDYATQNPSGLVTGANQLADAVGLDSSAGNLGWELVVAAIGGALADLLATQDVVADLDTAHQAELQRALEVALGQGDVTLDRAFFEREGHQALLSQIEAPIRQWLVLHTGSGTTADNLVRRLPAYFTYSLHEQWQRQPDRFRPLLDALRTPFSEAADQEAAWRRYLSRLRRDVNEPMFGESFGIQQVFVSPNAYYETEVRVGPGSPGQDAEAKQRKTVVELIPELMSWAQRGTNGNAVRVIAGGPGSGKSSVARIFAAQLADRGEKVLFIPLHLMDATRDLESAVGAFVSEQGILPKNPLDATTAEKRLLLILDGLDELAMQGRASAEMAQKLVAEVQRYVANRNHARLRLQVLLTGRDIVVQLNSPEFRQPQQVLHVLPYYVSWGSSQGYHDTRGLLNNDLRHDWWRLYASAKSRAYSGMPDSLRRPDLDEITSQPLLGYLIALSFDRGNLDFTKKGDATRNAIYEDLVAAVYERGYAGGRPHPSLRGLPLEAFRQLLEEVALATWHGDGRSATAADIHRYCLDGGLAGFVDAFEEGAATGATRLLTAFYFRQRDGRRQGERTFEFTHKSFREYLTACRLKRALETIADEVATRLERPGRGWSQRDALLHWAEVAGPTAMDEYVREFFVGELFRLGADVATRWQRLLAGLIEAVVRESMPMEGLRVRPAYAQEQFRARNAEEALLACASACSVVSGATTDVSWPARDSFGSWVRRLVGQRTSSSRTGFALRCLEGLRLDGQDLRAADLTGAELPRASFRGAILIGVDLQQAHLTAADFTEADLRGANLSGAMLGSADLSRTQLGGCRFAGAQTHGMRLEGALISGASISGEHLQASKGKPVLEPRE